MRNKKTVQCRDCKKIYTRNSGIRKYEGGRCRSCAASKRLIGNSFAKGYKFTEEQRERQRKASMGNKKWLGKHHTPETKQKIREITTGKKASLETRFKMSNSHKGEKAVFWKGGVTPENEKIRKSLEYCLWREACMKRDNFTCQKTGQWGGELRVHHINNFSDNPELRTSINNGITLSKKAHQDFHKKYGIKNNTREQLIEFLNNK